LPGFVSFNSLFDSTVIHTLCLKRVEHFVEGRLVLQVGVSLRHEPTEEHDGRISRPMSHDDLYHPVLMPLGAPRSGQGAEPGLNRRRCLAVQFTVAVDHGRYALRC
jgi:hypothetical protein